MANCWLSTSSVITCWGSQYSQFHSVICSKKALRRYSLDPQAKFNSKHNKKGDDNVHEKVLNILCDHQFWNDLEDVEQILQPIHEAQKMSESDDAHIGHVIKHWDFI